MVLSLYSEHHILLASSEIIVNTHYPRQKFKRKNIIMPLCELDLGKISINNDFNMINEVF